MSKKIGGFLAALMVWLFAPAYAKEKHVPESFWIKADSQFEYKTLIVTSNTIFFPFLTTSGVSSIAFESPNLLLLNAEIDFGWKDYSFSLKYSTDRWQQDRIETLSNEFGLPKTAVSLTDRLIAALSLDKIIIEADYMRFFGGRYDLVYTDPGLTVTGTQTRGNITAEFIDIFLGWALGKDLGHNARYGLVLRRINQPVFYIRKNMNQFIPYSFGTSPNYTAEYTVSGTYDLQVVHENTYQYGLGGGNEFHFWEYAYLEPFFSFGGTNLESKHKGETFASVLQAALSLKFSLKIPLGSGNQNEQSSTLSIYAQLSHLVGLPANVPESEQDTNIEEGVSEGGKNGRRYTKIVEGGINPQTYYSSVGLGFSFRKEF